jgi:hypothetical protein
MSRKLGAVWSAAAKNNLRDVKSQTLIVAKRLFTSVMLNAAGSKDCKRPVKVTLLPADQRAL